MSRHARLVLISFAALSLGAAASAQPLTDLKPPAAAPSSLEWSEEASREAARQERQAHLDSGGAPAAAGTPLALHVEHVFLRNVPGVATGAWALLGLELAGAGSGDRPLGAVAKPSAAEGAAGESRFDDTLAVLDASLGAGELTLTLLARTEATDDEHLRLDGFHEGMRRVTRGARLAKENHVHALRAALVYFSAATKGSPWRPRFVLKEAGGSLTLGRHAFVMLPPVGSPLARILDEKHLLRALEIRGRALLWKDSGRPYRESPWVLVRVAPAP